MSLAIPYLFFLGLYLLAVVILLFFGLASLYHLLRFSALSPVSVTMTFIMMAGTAIIIFLSYQQLIVIDWQQSLDLRLVLQALNPF
ncbi:hypothetical protein KKC17_02900 [Patescibacteria group bacterium]|nr:hypothetical protein [Patescibacteria group bacterium]